uniref:hypothetical protein n=1 Tax=Amycolatopsis sp. CA-082387 TaxID=3239918 RepID=UPI003F4990DA
MFSKPGLLCKAVERFDTEDDVLVHVATADPDAQRLSAFETHFDDRLFWIMPTLGEAWNVEIDEEPSAEYPFTLERAALRRLVPFTHEIRQHLNNHLADAEYEYLQAGDANEQVENDLAVLSDLQALTLAVLRADTAVQTGAYSTPHVQAVDRAIQWRMAQARAELAFLSGLRAENLRAEFGVERGAQGRMAEALGVSASAVSQMLTTADRRVAALRTLAARMNDEDD